MSSGRSSDDCLDEDDESSVWTETDSLAGRIEDVNWDPVPETPQFDPEVGISEQENDEGLFQKEMEYVPETPQTETEFGGNEQDNGEGLLQNDSEVLLKNAEMIGSISNEEKRTAGSKQTEKIFDEEEEFGQEGYSEPDMDDSGRRIRREGCVNSNENG